MTANGKYKRGQSGNSATRFKPGNQYRFQPGQSGNAAGIARSRLAFEEAFYAALLGHGSAEEVADPLWDAARKREPWAIQAILQRLAPEAKQINITHGVQDDAHIDYTRLSSEELDQLEGLLERAKIPVGAGDSSRPLSSREMTTPGPTPGLSPEQFLLNFHPFSTARSHSLHRCRRKMRVSPPPQETRWD